MRWKTGRVVLMLAVVVSLVVGIVYQGWQRYQALMDYRLNAELGSLAATLEAAHLFAADYRGLSTRDIDQAVRRSPYGLLTAEATGRYALYGMPVEITAEQRRGKPAFSITLSDVGGPRCEQLAGYQQLYLEGRKQQGRSSEVMTAFERAKEEFSVQVNGQPAAPCQPRDNRVAFRFERP